MRYGILLSLQAAKYQSLDSGEVRHKLVHVRDIHSATHNVQRLFFFQFEIEPAQEVFGEDVVGLRFVWQHDRISRAVRPRQSRSWLPVDL